MLMSLKMKTLLPVLGIVLCLVVSFAFVAVYKYSNEKIVPVANHYENTEEYLHHIDYATIENDYIKIEGWCIKPSEEIINTNVQVVIYRKGDDDLYGLNTIMKKRPEITEQMADGNSYTFGGFAAIGRIENIEPGEYHIALLKALDGAEDFRLIKTDITLVI